MNANLNRPSFWSPDVWAAIDNAAQGATGPIRVAQKVFPPPKVAPPPGAMTVPADIFHSSTMSMTEGQTKPYIEISSEFSLTSGQVGESTGATGMALATFAATSLAHVEDLVFFQGAAVQLPPTVKIESGRESAGKGLLGLVNPDHVILVGPADTQYPTNSGAEILEAIAKGVSFLTTSQQQAAPFSLILDTNAYAATGGSVINGAPTITVLKSLWTDSIYGSAALPLNTGLLVALGGDPTLFYVGSDLATEHTQREREGKCFFRVFERVQIVARDPRAFVKLDFSRKHSKK